MINYSELGKLIRALRLQRGISGQQLARTIGTSQASISRLENGTPIESIAALKYDTLVSALAPSFEMKQQLDILAGMNQKRSSYTFLPSVDMQSYGIDGKGWRALENNTSLSRIFCPWSTPSLLKTEAHLQSSIEWLGTPKDKVQEKLHYFTNRQTLLDQPTKRFEFIPFESCLMTLNNHKKLWLEQLNLLDEASRRSNISLNIITFRRNLPAITSGAFVLLDSARVIAELPPMENLYTDSKIVCEYEKLWIDLKNLALDKEGSRDLIWNYIDLAQKSQ